MELLPFSMEGKPPDSNQTCWEAEAGLGSLSNSKGQRASKRCLQGAAIKGRDFPAGSATRGQQHMRTRTHLWAPTYTHKIEPEPGGCQQMMPCCEATAENPCGRKGKATRRATTSIRNSDFMSICSLVPQRAWSRLKALPRASVCPYSGG